MHKEMEGEQVSDARYKNDSERDKSMHKERERESE